jgi:hypothetical protein
MRKFIAKLCTVTLLFASASLAVAQDAASIRAIFASAPKTPTSVAGVSVFQAPPKGFDALNASWQDLARYGLPQRPNQQTEPERYARWARAMTALGSAKFHPTDVKALPYHSSPAKLITPPQTGAAAQAVSNVPGTLSSGNWSGVINSNKLTKWSANTSFDFIESAFVVPSAYPPFNACANGITGPFLMSAWNGIDGYKSGDVVQGGIMTYSDCGGPADNFYIAWVEWFPSYPELEINAPVNPGDTVFVETFASPGTDTQTVFVEDVSQPWSGSFSLTYITGPGVIGNSEEQVVERPCCNGSDFYALNNYDYDYFADALGEDAHGTIFYVGEQTTATLLVDMYDDLGTQIISEPLEQGSAGNAGKYMLWVSDEGCAYSGGCTP